MFVEYKFFYIFVFMSNKVNLSELDLNLNLTEILVFMIMNNYDTIINDLREEPRMEYDLEDLSIVWENLQKMKL